ncbi:hypothetical protein [Thalassotalea sp. PLHSN55]|uniref:hypothetical protein n=1 Tax=Thalassotalea sp. PLHSN55 TaxID=3435888 RepID=UPI003F8389A7
MKRWLSIIILPLLMIAITAVVVYQHDEHINMVKMPPKALAQWYKPQNKRQVWLHTMFQLRREMQAVDYYAKQQDSELMKKWMADLTKHYGKIAEMVPTWRKNLDYNALAQLQAHVDQNQFSQVSTAVNSLQKNCDSCHDDYQAITALTYRTPDFSTITLDSPLSYQAHMNKLTRQVNQIKISAQDGNVENALASLNDLKVEMDVLGKSCVNCHRGGKAYPDETVVNTLNSLENSLVNGSAKEQGRDLGTLAVLACAQCHGTHRLSYGAKTKINQQSSWLDMLKHN